MCYEIQCKASAAPLAALSLDLWALLMDCNYAMTNTAKEDWIGGRAMFKQENEA